MTASNTLRRRSALSAALLAMGLIVALAVMLLQPTHSAGETADSYTHAEIDSPTLIGATPQEAVAMLSARVLEGNAERDIREQQRFTVISAAGFGARASSIGPETAIFEATENSQLLGRFEVSPLGAGWAVTELTVRVPSWFCQPGDQ